MNVRQVRQCFWSVVMSSELTTSFPLWQKDIPFWRQWYISRKKIMKISFFKAWNVPLHIIRRHLKPSLKQKWASPRTPLELRLPSAAFRQKPRLCADSNTRFVVRIFILSDSNFFQSQKHWFFNRYGLALWYDFPDIAHIIVNNGSKTQFSKHMSFLKLHILFYNNDQFFLIVIRHGSPDITHIKANRNHKYAI